MNIHCQMFIPPKANFVIGAINVTKEEIILFKKSKFIALGFGAIGAIISAKSKGKEFQRIQFSNVRTIEMKKFKMSKKACYVTLMDESEYIFKLPKPEATIASLQQSLKEAKKIDF